MNTRIIKTGILLALLSIITGAFGAHALKQRVAESVMPIFETAVRYQLYHSIALIISGILFKEFSNMYIKIAGYLFISGIILFSGSLYFLTFIKGYNINGLDWTGIITPIGGLLFIAGWFTLFLGTDYSKKF